MKTVVSAVLSEDPTFSDLLRIELKYLGAECTDGVGRECDFLVVDLDTASIPEGFLRENCLTFSRTDSSADLIRPFSIEDFRSAILSRFSPMGIPEGRNARAGEAPEGDELLITDSDAFFGGNAMKLTKTELALLSLLAENRGALVGEDVIRRTVFPGSTGNAVQVYVRYLRQKLEKFTRVRYVERLRGQGYRLLTDGLTVVFRKGKEDADG